MLIENAATTMENSSVSFWTQFKEMIKLLFYKRFRDQVGIVTFIIAIVFTPLYLFIDYGSMGLIKDNKTPEVINYGQASTYFNTYLLLDMINVSVSPETDAIKDFSNTVFLGKNVSYHNSIEEIREKFKANPNTYNIGYSFDPNNLYDVTVLTDVYTDIGTGFMAESLLKNEQKAVNVDVNVSGFPHPALPSGFELSALTTLYIFFGITIMLSGILTQWQKMIRNKEFFLLKVDGLKEFTGYFAAFVYTLLENLIICIIDSCFTCFYGKGTIGTNFFFVIVSLILLAIQMFLYLFIFANVTTTDNGIAASIGLFYLMEVIAMTIFIFIDYIPEAVLYIIMAIIPSGGVHAFFYYITKMKLYYSPLTFSNASTRYVFTLGEIFGLQIFNLVIILIILVVILLCCKRPDGRAPFGWKGLFSFSRWKKIFNRRNSFLQSIVLTDNAFDLERVDKTYASNGTHALNELTASVVKGETILLIGPNGSGKSTLFKTLIGEEDVNSGDIMFFGENITHDNHVLLQNLGYVGQDNIFINEMSVYENLMLFSMIRGVSKEDAQDEINRLLSLLELDSHKDMRPKNLSGGFKRKFCCAIALIKSPSILILDEPTSGVDVEARQAIWKTVGSLNNTTSIISTHSLEESESVASRIFVMKEGQIVFNGTPVELRTMSHCGYLLSIIEGTGTVDQLYEFVSKIVPDSILNEDKVNIPADVEIITNVIEQIEQNKEKLGIEKYTIHLESLEDVMLKFINEHENIEV